MPPKSAIELKTVPRARVSIDLPPESDAAFRRLATRYFRSSSADTARAAISVLTWLVTSREHGRRVIAVGDSELPERYEVPVIAGLEELLTDEWQWLVSRPHPWRRQLWLKGRRIAAGDLARTIEIEGWSPEQAASEYDLPLPAVQEAQRYLAANRALVIAEEHENQLAAQGIGQPPTTA